MTNKEFKLWCDRYEITVDEASKVLGTSRANAFKFAKGSRPVSKLVRYQCEVIDLLTKEQSALLIKRRILEANE